jgi:hypothetical protein
VDLGGCSPLELFMAKEEDYLGKSLHGECWRVALELEKSYKAT